MKPRFDWYDVLDLFCWGIETLGHPSLRRTLTGREEEAFRPFDSTMWRRLQSQQWLIRRGRGANATFTITPLGKRQCATPDPRVSWNRPWKGRWWLVTFDVPEVTRRLKPGGGS